MQIRRPLKIALGAALAAATLAAAAADRVEVRFLEQVRFTDDGSTALERGRTRDALAAYLQLLGRQLPEGQVLKVEITDIDLAGWTRWTRQGDIRVLNGGADWPRIALRYELQAQGRTLQAGEDDLKDLNYLAHPQRSAALGDLPYEKRLLAEWFGERFTAAAR